MTTYKILVIDDAFFIRNLIKKAVMRKPIKNDVHFEIIGEAQDGATGLEMCKELQPDIITVDFNIPELNGLDFAKYLKEMNPKIPILMISSNTDPTFPQQVDEIGCHFLQKPFQEAHLWMRLDTLVNEIENFDESQVKKEQVSEETLSILEEITMEVEAELEEEQIELEEMTLPKVNQPKQTSEPAKKKKKKKKKNNNGDLFGLQIDDSIVIKPKNENISKTNTKIEPSKFINEKPIQNITPVPTIQIEKLIEPINESKKDNNVVVNKPSMNIPKIDLNLGKSLEEDIVIENETNIPKIDLNLGKPSEEDIVIDNETIIIDEPLIAIVDDEEIIIDDEDVPLIIDDEEDTLIIIDDEEEIIIEDEDDNDIIIDDSDDEFEIIGDDEIFIGDDITQNNQENLSNSTGVKIGLNIKKPPVEEKEDLSLLSEKELNIRNLIDNVSYSYQTEMSYVLHVMEKIKRPEAYVEENVIVEEPEKQNKLGIEQPVEIIKDLTKEDEDAEFDKLFAEFNPNLDLNTSTSKQTKEIKKDIDLKNSPSISNTIVIEPPKSQKVQALYGGKNKDENTEFILPIEDKPKKVSIFTKIFNFFNKKK